MTLEEAIERLEWYQCHAETKEDADAFDMAISALHPVSREQVEKVWRGEWLNFYNDFSAAECSTCGELYEVSPDEEPKKEYFDAFKSFYHFCPNCGKAMTDEAVEMVMERLEELSNGKG